MGSLEFKKEGDWNFFIKMLRTRYFKTPKNMKNITKRTEHKCYIIYLSAVAKKSEKIKKKKNQNTKPQTAIL